MHIVFLNGEYIPRASAKISIFDRGVLFSDAVYEVISVLGGALIDIDRHIERMERSLRELSIKADADWSSITSHLIKKMDSKKVWSTSKSRAEK